MYLSLESRCIHLRNHISNHSHFGPCLNGNKYSYYLQKSNDLDNCIDITDKALKLKEKIIENNNNLKIKKQEQSQSEELSNKKYESMKVQFEKEEDLERKKNDEYLKGFEEKNKNNKKKAKNTLKELEKEIENLKDNIHELGSQKDWEIKKKQEELLNRLEHDYEMQLDQYKFQKELQKLKEEARIRELEEEWKNQKEIEFNELREKAKLINKLIYSFKILNN